MAIAQASRVMVVVSGILAALLAAQPFLLRVADIEKGSISMEKRSKTLLFRRAQVSVFVLV